MVIQLAGGKPFFCILQRRRFYTHTHTHTHTERERERERERENKCNLSNLSDVILALSIHVEAPS